MTSDALANERTFLAYVRTALAFVAFGFVVARFSLFAREISTMAHIAVPSTHESSDFGIAVAAIGIVVGIYGAWRYAQTNAAIAAAQPRPMPVWAAWSMAVALVAIGVIVAAALVQVR